MIVIYYLITSLVALSTIICLYSIVRLLLRRFNNLLGFRFSFLPPIDQFVKLCRYLPERSETDQIMYFRYPKELYQNLARNFILFDPAGWSKDSDMDLIRRKFNKIFHIMEVAVELGRYEYLDAFPKKHTSKFITFILSRGNSFLIRRYGYSAKDLQGYKPWVQAEFTSTKRAKVISLCLRYPSRGSIRLLKEMKKSCRTTDPQRLIYEGIETLLENLSEGSSLYLLKDKKKTAILDQSYLQDKLAFKQLKLLLQREDLSGIRGTVYNSWEMRALMYDIDGVDPKSVRSSQILDYLRTLYPVEIEQEFKDLQKKGYDVCRPEAIHGIGIAYFRQLVPLLPHDALLNFMRVGSMSEREVILKSNRLRSLKKTFLNSEV